jgi:tRNA-specific 2-thiouridylase
VVTVGTLADLMRREQPVMAMTWVHVPAGLGEPVLVQTSAHGDALPAVYTGRGIAWAEPQRRVAPGQSIVLYDLDNAFVVGGGLAA